MKPYLYPKNLKAKANLWLWGMRDFILLCASALLSILALVELGWLIPAALTLCFAFLTVRKDEMTVLDYLKYAIRYFLTDQQYYEWK
ncbi:MAG: hypothetical protein ACLR3U_00565 [Christensenellaceae bacterium]|jgi:hypothetical protein|nr:MAG: hypothetical protein DBY05_05950 [Clostridiales bacterium]